MRPKYCLNPQRSIFAALLPSGALADLASLWVLPETIRFSGNELGIISDAFSGRRMAVWKSSAYWKAAMDHLLEKPEVLDRLERYGVFKPDDRMIGGIISRCTVWSGEGAAEIDKFHSKYIYSDVAWVNSSAVAEMADPFRGWMLGSNSALAFLRDDGNQPHLWARLVQSLGFQGLVTEAAINQKMLSTPDSMMSMEKRNLEYLAFVVGVCAASGIVPTMQCLDSDTASAMVFWGAKEELEDAACGLAGSFEPMQSIELERWLRRGASFVVCH